IRTEEKLVQMQNGCICYTLREDLLLEVAKLAKEGRFDYLLIESTGISEPMPVAETFLFEDGDGNALSRFACLDTMATVVDAKRFVDDFKGGELLADRGMEMTLEDERTIADLLADQVEFANVLVLNKCDVVPEAELARLEATLKRLNPSARVVRSTFGKVSLDNIFDTGLFDFEKAATSPGWMSTLRGEEQPETEEYGIGSFVYRACRPFDPVRLCEFFEQDCAGLLRAKGFVFLSHDPKTVYLWSLAGSLATLNLYGYWDEGMLRQQEMVFIGQNVDEAAVRAQLDACLAKNGESGDITGTLFDPAEAEDDETEEARNDNPT
ncbi:MAG: GTP-binding protein, partial [Fibrella sp.]|nr:GTP-binding protein [Armatimonadota bacterium]